MGLRHIVLLMVLSRIGLANFAWMDTVVTAVRSEACFRSYAGQALEPKEKARELFYILTNLRKINEDPALEHFVEGEVVKRMLKNIEEGKPIKMYIACFPAKSPNHKTKTLGADADLAEEIAMERLNSVVRAMNQIHPTELMLVSDGRMFADTWWSNDAAVDNYQAQLKKLATTPNLQVIEVNHFFPGLTPAQARDKTMQDYAPTVEEVRDSFTDPARLRLYQAFSRFIRDDVPPDDPALVGLSGKKKDQLFKDRAIDDIRRSDALNKLLAERLGKTEGYIRLSIRESTDTPDKLGINLLDGTGQEFTATPWHSVVVVYPDGAYQVMKRDEAEKRNYRLMYRNGRPHHFEAPAALY